MWCKVLRRVGRSRRTARTSSTWTAAPSQTTIHQQWSKKHRGQRREIVDVLKEIPTDSHRERTKAMKQVKKNNSCIYIDYVSHNCKYVSVYGPNLSVNFEKENFSCIKRLKSQRKINPSFSLYSHFLCSYS